MSIAPALATRVLLSASFAAALALHTGCSGQNNPRSDPPAAGAASAAGGLAEAAGIGSAAAGDDSSAGKDSAGGASSVGGNDSAAGAAPAAGTASVGGADDGSGGGAAVSWCEAYKLINCVCQQCHQDPTLHGAAMPLMTYEDTQAPFPFPTSTATVWQTMQSVISNRFMPYTGDSTVIPPVKPLSDAQRNTLLAWLDQGATAAGGTACPMTCDWSKGPPTGPF